jgi:hypothetical protein
MIAVGIVQAVLCVVVVMTLAVFGPLADYQLRSYIRRTYPRIWRRFGFPSDTYLVPPEVEHESIIADIGYREFFSTGKYKTLNDPRLNTLRQRGRALIWIGGVAMALMVLNFMIFRTAPDFSWLIGGR